MKKTLLDLDHTPTLEELKAFFKLNDFSVARFYDDENLSYEQINGLSEIGNIAKEKWDEIAKDMVVLEIFYKNNNVDKEEDMR